MGLVELVVGFVVGAVVSFLFIRRNPKVEAVAEDIAVKVSEKLKEAKIKK